MDEIPCSHAWAVLKKKFLDPEPYCFDLYKPNTLLVTYANPINPLPDRKDWNVPAYVENEIVKPPKFKKLPGRPPKKLRDKTYIFVVLVVKRDILSDHAVMDHELNS